VAVAADDETESSTKTIFGHKDNKQLSCHAQCHGGALALFIMYVFVWSVETHIDMQSSQFVFQPIAKPCEPRQHYTADAISMPDSRSAVHYSIFRTATTACSTTTSSSLGEQVAGRILKFSKAVPQAAE
jgi:hypothetical protein